MNPANVGKRYLSGGGVGGGGGIEVIDKEFNLSLPGAGIRLGRTRKRLNSGLRGNHHGKDCYDDLDSQIQLDYGRGTDGKKGAKGKGK